MAEILDFKQESEYEMIWDRFLNKNLAKKNIEFKKVLDFIDRESNELEEKMDDLDEDDDGTLLLTYQADAFDFFLRACAFFCFSRKQIRKMSAIWPGGPYLFQQAQVFGSLDSWKPIDSRLAANAILFGIHYMKSGLPTFWRSGSLFESPEDLEDLDDLKDSEEDIEEELEDFEEADDSLESPSIEELLQFSDDSYEGFFPIIMPETYESRELIVFTAGMLMDRFLFSIEMGDILWMMQFNENQQFTIEAFVPGDSCMEPVPVEVLPAMGLDPEMYVPVESDYSVEKLVFQKAKIDFV